MLQIILLYVLIGVHSPWISPNNNSYHSVLCGLGELEIQPIFHIDDTSGRVNIRIKFK